MNGRRHKLERIIEHYEIPFSARSARKLVSQKPLSWFTDNQLEDIARDLIRQAALVARMNKANREIYARRVKQEGVQCECK